jgi:hypothetical protein
MNTLYGILKTSYNSGLASELAAVFASPLSITSNQPAFVSDTGNLRRRVASQGVQRWEIETSIVPTNSSALFFVNSISAGFVEKVYVRMPQIPGIKRLRGGIDDVENLSLATSTACSAGSRLVNVSGLGNDNFGIGEFIRFDSDSKVYAVTDPGINGSGMQVHPPLRTTVYPSTKVWYGSKVTMTARYDTDVAVGIRFSDGILLDPGTIKLVEAL